MRFLPVPAELEKVAEAVASWARGQRRVGAVCFFGSRLRGEGRPGSDLDVAVQLDSPVDAVLADFIFAAEQWREELSRLVPYGVDLQLADQCEAPNVWNYLVAGCACVYLLVPAAGGSMIPTISAEQEAKVFDYFERLPDDRDATIGGLARHAKLNHRTAKRLLSDPEFRTHAESRRQWTEAEISEAGRQAPGELLDFGREVWERERRDAVRAALTDAADNACRNTTHEQQTG
jgi:predicted nucleotidyltransferase